MVQSSDGQKFKLGKTHSSVHTNMLSNHHVKYWEDGMDHFGANDRTNLQK